MRHTHPAQPAPHVKQPKRRFRKAKRFFCGYLMLVGAMTTLYVLVQLLVWILVELGKRVPN